MPYDPAIYAGCAAYYLQGRPPYSRELPQALAARLALPSGARLLDVGAGPGSLAFALKELFTEVVALEPDADMAAVGAAHSNAAGVAAVRYVIARAEALAELRLGVFDLVTFGQSFHWTDRPAVSALTFASVAPGGGVAIVTHRHQGRPIPANPGAPLIPHDDVHALIRRYLGPRRRAGAGFPPDLAGFDEEAVFTAAGFVDAERFYCPGRADLIRDVDSVVANFLSMSFAAPPLFGDRLDDFVGELRGLLLDRSPSGLFWDWPGDTEVVLARRPGHASVQ